MKRIHLANESKWDYIKVEANNKYEDAKIFCDRHKKELAEAGISIVVATVPGLVKKGLKARDIRKAKEVKELYCYDRSLGHYWKLRRELTNDEWLRIDKRKANGERLSDILAEMKVLK